ncbi:MAG TPA: prepilin-type N-terminal cleavage/methylation domain-containing protein [Gemmatimonadaceae bacterium]|jgi:prepilin-type N-terminal cleavage/methylation domain-containing protein|nr:prepilin-type N-terminal cleavage/methylation domain-containing protein [Gemmatimonadaceae bacterium]
MPIARSRRGLTLLELVVALSISGLVMLGGVMLLDQVGDSDARIVRESLGDATAGNGDRLLRRLLVDAQSTTDTVHRFRGDERNASYLTRCDRPSGWSEPCRARLSVDSLGDSSAIVVETDRGERFEVRRVAGIGTLRYLSESSDPDSAWVRRWTTSIALPAAIAFIVSPDTTIWPLGSVRD